MYFEITYLKDGRKETTIIKADNFIEATKKFRNQRLGVFLKIKETSEPLSVKIDKLKEEIDKKLSGKIDLEEYVAILEQIYVMLDASLSLNDILSSVSENIKNKKLKEIFTQLNQDIQSGINISTSLKRYEKDIGKLSISMIELGEHTCLLTKFYH